MFLLFSADNLETSLLVNTQDERDFAYGLLSQAELEEGELAVNPLNII